MKSNETQKMSFVFQPEIFQVETNEDITNECLKYALVTTATSIYKGHVVKKYVAIPTYITLFFNGS